MGPVLCSLLRSTPPTVHCVGVTFDFSGWVSRCSSLKALLVGPWVDFSSALCRYPRLKHVLLMLMPPAQQTVLPVDWGIHLVRELKTSILPSVVLVTCIHTNGHNRCVIYCSVAINLD